MTTEKSPLALTKEAVEKGKNYLSAIFDIPENEIYLEELEKGKYSWKITFSFYELIPAKAEMETRNPILQALKPLGDLESKPDYRKVYKLVDVSTSNDRPPSIKNHSA